ncbi:hypothetical protein [Pannonibacter indicus]|uniref:hypothetical protein n=1 Tax=Pannonibacter indicus TaxID=466044 RepID=UPI00391D9392
MTGHTLYYLSDHCEDTAPHELTLEGIRDYLRSHKPLLKARYHNLATLEALAWVKLSLDETGCWQTHPSMPVQSNFFVLVDAYGSMTWDAESILSGRSLDVMLWGYDPEDVEWLLCMRETTGLRIRYDGGDSLPAIVPVFAQTAEDYEDRKATLSRRARAMLDRIEDDQHYPYERYMGSRTMAELVNAGLVRKMPRAATISVCYVPVIGFQPLVMDRVDLDAPERPDATKPYLAAADLMKQIRTSRNRLDILLKENAIHNPEDRDTVAGWIGEIDAIVACHSPLFCAPRQQEPA